MERAITECIREGILKDFLEKNRREAIRVSIYEYDEERHIRQEREDAWEEGRQEGRQESRKQIIKNMLKQKKTEEEIALLTGEPEETICELIAQIRSEASEE